MIIDTHAHYDDSKFDTDRDDRLLDAKKQGIDLIVNASQDLTTSKKGIALSEQYPFVYCCIGVHPHNADKCDQFTMDELARLAIHQKVIGIGETGLDYYYEFSQREIQKKSFIEHIRLAQDFNLPTIIHDRDAHEDTYNILKEEKIWKAGGVVHCFSGSVELAKKAIEMGLYISIGGAVTFKNVKNVLDVVKYIPDDRLLLETDCPYMTPEPHRGHRNESIYVKLVAKRISELKNREIEEIYEQTTSNFYQLFTKMK